MAPEKRHWRLTAVVSLVFVGIGLSLAQPAPAVWTDRSDYAPGSAVTFQGDAANGASMSPGETVAVTVRGPMRFEAGCRDVVDSGGAWSCSVRLAETENAYGSYTYTARGERSGAEAGGSFTSLALWHETRITDLGPASALGGGTLGVTAHLHVDVCRRYRCPGRGFCSFCSHDALEPGGRLVRVELDTRAVWLLAGDDGRIHGQLPVPRRSNWLRATFPGDDLLPESSASVWLVVLRARDMSESAKLPSPAPLAAGHD